MLQVVSGAGLLLTLEFTVVLCRYGRISCCGNVGGQIEKKVSITYGGAEEEKEFALVVICFVEGVTASLTLDLLLLVDA
jgi:hypothetical protein